MTRGPAALLPIFAVACSQCTDRGSVTDASDEFSVDAGARDAPKDVVLPDAAPGFRIYTELSNCDLQVAVDPSSSAAKIQWIVCPSTNASCSQLDTKGWEQDQMGTQPWISFARGSGKHDFMHIVHRISPPGFEASIYSVPAWTPIQTWRQRDGDKCDVLPILGPSNGALLQITPTVNSLASATMPKIFVTPTYSQIMPLVPDGQMPAFFSMSDTTIAFDMQPLHEVARLPFGQSTYVYTKGVKLADPTVIGDDVYAYNEYGVDGWSREMRVNADGSTTLYRAAPQRHVSALRGDSSWIAWMETFGDSNYANPDQPNAELWGAPYTNDPSTLASTAKKIATLVGVRTELPEPRYSSGYYAIRAGTSDGVKPIVYVVRVSDGVVKTLDVNALVGPDTKNPYFFETVSSVNATEVIGILAKVNASPHFSLVRIQLGSWP